ncbi:N-acetyl-gamma-glutamyl-phosphate reductase [bacterium]|nr:N-acetyl-gamma-glutamyl-phosphate reductase [bacterium]
MESGNRKIRVAILGATGYTGEEATRFLLDHPRVEIARLFSLEFVGKKVWEPFPRFSKKLDLVIEEFRADSSLEDCDVVMGCLPHKASMGLLGPLVEKGIKVIDLSADFRFAEVETYSAAYGVEHKYPHLLKEAVYGLPELNRDKLKGCSLVAVPGCYPTSAILGAAPLLKERLVRPSGIIIDAKTGISGAGRAPSARFHFPECNESVSPYGIGKHRHQPEIEEQFSRLYKGEVKVTFAPHLAPMTRGILSTIYLDPQGDVSLDRVRRVYEAMYADEPFVTVLGDGLYPRTADVTGTNSCHIGFTKTAEGKIVVACAIDNLVKGASGQAIQGLNAVFGFDETDGLTRV